MTDTLPAPNWTRRKDLDALITALDPTGDDVRYVGGAVRDTLLGLPVKDIDIATRLLPDDVMKRGKAAGLVMIPTGIEHGTITAALPEGPVEITTLRHDVATDGRRATVAFATGWAEDAARRDFTINALYAHPRTLEIFDPFDGRIDLAAGRVRFIGDARERIREDHLRILRYFRFMARFGNREVDHEARGACAELAASLKGLSRERIAAELLALMGLPDPSSAAVLMDELGVWPHVLPERDPEGLNRLERLLERERRFDVAPDALVRMSAMLPGDAAVADAVAARLRFSKARRKVLIDLATAPSPADDARPLAYSIGTERARQAVMVRRADDAIDALMTSLADFNPPRFAILGRDVIARGIGAGPEVAGVLQAVEKRWIAEGFPDEARQRALLDEVLSD